MTESREEILALVAQHKTATTVANQISMGGKLTTTIDVEREGTTFQFQIKRPNMGDYMKMGTLKAKLLMQGSVDPVPLAMLDASVKQIATVVSTLAVVVVKAPDGFVPEECDEYEFLEAIYMKYVAWVNSFRRTGTKPASGGGEPAAGTETVGDSPVIRNAAD